MAVVIQTLRPHHLLDILAGLKASDMAGPAPECRPGENGVRTITHALAANLDTPVKFVVGPDDICRPCDKLRPDLTCSRFLPNREPPVAFDDYNNPLDRAILKKLGMRPDQVLPLREFLTRVRGNCPGLERVCAHAHQDAAQKLSGILQGLEVLGITRGGGMPVPAAPT